MAQKRLPMRKVRKILKFRFDEGRSARAIATHCGLVRRSVGQTLARYAASGLNRPEASSMDDAALEAAFCPARQVRPEDEDEDWAAVENYLAGRGMTLKLLWEEWRETHPDGMSYVTWNCQSRANGVRCSPPAGRRARQCTRTCWTECSRRSTARPAMSWSRELTTRPSPGPEAQSSRSAPGARRSSAWPSAN